MVIASHVIFGAYGFWLPNDPRGSWSEFVGAWELYRRGGRATKVETRQSVAGVQHDRNRRQATKESLTYPAVCFTDAQIGVIGSAFGEFAARNGLGLLACAIMPEHVHLVIARHRYKVEQAVVLLKGEASRRLETIGLHPMAAFPRKKERLATCWGRGEWKVFLDSEADVTRAIRYVEENPVKEGRAVQRWEFCHGMAGLDARRSD
jgi:REP element-mobilizing transposase RayT